MSAKEVEDFQPVEDGPPEVLALQPIAIVDHLCQVPDEASLRALVGGEALGGSHRVTQQEVSSLLSGVGEFTSKAGGSAANTTRVLAGLGVKAALLGARGLDEYGAIFTSSMRRAHVDVSRVVAAPGPTGRCVILSCHGQRTMRTSMAGCPRLAPAELGAVDFEGVKYAFLSAYVLYNEGLLERAVELAGGAGARLAFDLASFEVVRAFAPAVRALLESGAVSICFCNEDEAAELGAEVLGTGGVGAEGGAAPAAPEAVLAWLSARCDVAVVTLGEKGCLVQERGGAGALAAPACSGVVVVDTTGAGDCFAGGFLFGLLRGFPPARCAEVGCIAGGAVVQTLGAEMSSAGWQFLHSRLHGELAGALVRDSAAAVQRELVACYALIEARGRGVVYYGSARLREESPHWGRAVELGREVAALLGVTSWSGGGPGMMEAATRGAMAAGHPVAGIRISREAGTTVRTASYLPEGSAVFCRFLSSRKVALVDSGVRQAAGDRTAYIFLPGGLGTLDELFEILTLMQLRKLGSKHPVPLILVNWDGFFAGMLSFLQACVANGTVGVAELRDVVLAPSNAAAVGFLAKFYGLPGGEADGGDGGAVAAADWLQAGYEMTAPA